jgi:hypothetical protein
MNTTVVQTYTAIDNIDTPVGNFQLWISCFFLIDDDL